MFQTFKLLHPLDKESYKDIPSTTGIYIFKRGETFLYIGKSVNIKARVLSHVENTVLSEKEMAIVSQSDHIDVAITDSEFKALLLESQLIQKHMPKFNVIWKDGKSYLYIKITKEKFPKISAVRKEDDGNSLYFGPFSSNADVEDLLRIIRKIVPFCTQRKATSRPCFYSKIHLCNPCPNMISSLKDTVSAARFTKEYKSNIRKIKQILKGNTDLVFNSLKEELNQSIQNQDFEKGILLRNRIQSLEYLTRYRSFDRYRDTDFNTSQSGLLSLQKTLIPYFPFLSKLERIECYDISNLSQKQATGSMVVLTHGLIDKDEYRKFKIKNSQLQSDFDMLEEVLKRRFHNKWKSPNLVVIDGGKPQIRRVMRVMGGLGDMGKKMPVIGIAKHPDRFIMGVEGLPTLRLKTNDLGLRLVQLIRDESHRFARKYHLFLRDRIVV